MTKFGMLHPVILVSLFVFSLSGAFFHDCPLNVSAIEKGSNFVILQWSHAGEEDPPSYIVKVRSSKGRLLKRLNSHGDTPREGMLNQTVSHLHPSTTYKFSVGSKNYHACTDDVVIVTTDPPHCPANASVLDKGPDYVTLQWSPAQFCDKGQFFYTIKYRSVHEGGNQTIESDKEMQRRDKISHTISNLKPLTKFTFTVSVNHFDCSEHKVVLTTDHPGCPINVSVLDKGPDYITLHWSPSFRLLTPFPYRVTYHRVGSTGNKTVNIKGIQTRDRVTLTVADLEPMTRYSLRIGIRTVQCPDNNITVSTEKCGPVLNSTVTTTSADSSKLSLAFLDKDGALKHFLVLIHLHGKKESNGVEDNGWAMSLVGWNPVYSPKDGWTLKLTGLEPHTKYDVEIWSQSCWNRVFHVVKRDGQLTCHETMFTILFMVGIAAGLVVAIIIGMVLCFLCIRIKRRRRRRRKISVDTTMASRGSGARYYDSVLGYSEIRARLSSNSQQQSSLQTTTADCTEILRPQISRLDPNGYTLVIDSQGNEYTEVSPETPLPSVEGYISLYDIPGTGHLDSEYSRLSHGSCVLERERRVYQKINNNESESKNIKANNS